jgi:hypothetical protein
MRPTGPNDLESYLPPEWFCYYYTVEETLCQSCSVRRDESAFAKINTVSTHIGTKRYGIGVLSEQYGTTQGAWCWTVLYQFADFL